MRVASTRARAGVAAPRTRDARDRGRRRDATARARRGTLGDAMRERDDASEERTGKQRGGSGCACGKDASVAYEACCGRAHGDANAAAALAAEDVMRARFTAYVVGDAQYIVSSTHEESKDRARESLLRDAENTIKRIRFHSFRAKRSSEKDGEAYVTYEADYTQGKGRGKMKTLAERARLRRDAETGGWKFVDAVALGANASLDDAGDAAAPGAPDPSRRPM